MTVDEKLIEVSDVAEAFGYNTSVIDIDTAIKLCHEALKKQREICAESYIMSPIRGEVEAIKNAPEPEL